MKKLLFSSILCIACISSNAQDTQTFTLANLPTKPISELLTRSSISGEMGTLGYFNYKKGAFVPVHQHINEQYSIIIRGSVEVKINDKSYILKSGDGIIIPPNTPHSFTSLEDSTINIDFFAPTRYDWLNGTDNYYTTSETKKETRWDGKKIEAEVYASVNEAVGNIAFTAQGDVVYSHHPFFYPKYRVMKYDAETKTSEPFPNEAWNTPRKGDDHYLSNVLGIRNDANGIVWMLDMGKRNAVTPKIVGWNTHTNKLEKIYYLSESALTPTSQPNDMIVDTKNGVFIIADEGIGNGEDGSTAALITVDMRTGMTRRLLEGSKTTLPENIPTIINGKPLSINGNDLLVGCDGITADKDYEWLYYAPLNGKNIYRIKIINLIDKNLNESELSKHIETYAEKPNNGGLSIDVEGNLYLTAVETQSVAIILAKDRSLHTLTTHENLIWPDGVSYNVVDGYMYVSAAQVNLGAVFNNGVNKSKPPFYIFRFKPITNGVPFR